MKHLFCLLLILSPFIPAVAQYAPQQGVIGSAAISASDVSITAWASECRLYRGYKYIDSPAQGYATNGDSSSAVGPADYSTVSLGDSGVADLTFVTPVFDGPGADFAVFENGFPDPANDSLAFLELAFVEVSSDGMNYVRFPAHSLTQTNVQIPGSGTYMYANLVDGLAGKYIGGYGTPFDLSDLPASSLLNKDSITHIRVVDVIGDVHGHSSLDITGRIINDPYPTNFASGGFDLDAVGLINRYAMAAVQPLSSLSYQPVYPNPSGGQLYIPVPPGKVIQVTLSSPAGNVLQAAAFSNSGMLDLTAYPAGLYFLSLQDANGLQWVEKIVKL